MNLIPTNNFRAAYTIKEVAEFLKLSPDDVRWQVQKGTLKRANRGKFGFLQADVNTFALKLNNGKA